MGSTVDGHRGQGRLPQVFCFRAQDGTGGLDLEVQREQRSVGNISGFLTGMVVG